MAKLLIFHQFSSKKLKTLKCFSLSALAPAFENIALIINFRYLHQFVFPLVILYNTKCYFIVSLGSIVAHVLSTWIKWWVCCVLKEFKSKREHRSSFCGFRIFEGGLPLLQIRTQGLFGTLRFFLIETAKITSVAWGKQGLIPETQINYVESVELRPPQRRHISSKYCFIFPI